MDACHLLLGRPWLFDRKVISNGYLNTYSFTKDGKKITHEFRSFRDWILTSLDEPETTSPNHPLVVALLQIFAHVFPDEIPASLPPERDI